MESAVKPVFDLQAHRGGRMVRPENTLAAFRYALELGVTTLEMDMHITADEQVVVSHNPVLVWQLTRDRQGRWLNPGQEPVVANLTLAALRQYNIGAVNPAAGKYWKQYGQYQQATDEVIPTLDDVFRLAEDYNANTIRFNIETKSYPDQPEWAPPPERFCQLVKECIDRFGVSDRVLLQSFDWRTLLAMQQLDPAICRVALTDRTCRILDASGQYPWLGGINLAEFGNCIILAAQAAGAQVLSPHYGDITSALLNEAARRGMPVIPWTVNDRQDMRQLIDWGVAGIITDCPAVLRDVMREKGMNLPTAFCCKKSSS